MIGLLIFLVCIGWLIIGLTAWAFISRKAFKSIALRRALAPVWIALWLFAPVADEILGARAFNNLCAQVPRLRFYGPVKVGSGLLFGEDGTAKWRDSRDFSSRFALSAAWKELFKLKIEYLPVVGIPTHVFHRHAKVIGPGGAVVLEDESYISRGGWIRSGKLSQLFAEQSCGSLDRWPDESSWIVFEGVGTR